MLDKATPTQAFRGRRDHRRSASRDPLGRDDGNRGRGALSGARAKYNGVATMLVTQDGETAVEVPGVVRAGQALKFPTGSRRRRRRHDHPTLPPGGAARQDLHNAGGKPDQCTDLPGMIV